MTPIKDSASDILSMALKPIYTDGAKNYFADKTVLVTGAGGSIGSEIVKQLKLLNTQRVICLDRDEYALYRLELEINDEALLMDENMVLCDIRDFGLLDKYFKHFKPDLVFHAAAVKHLPLLERAPEAAVITNILGTSNVAEVAAKHNVEKVINISTDKAANPTSVLGYSKRIAEMAASHFANDTTIVASVRFGNVFASRGSFIETLQWQADNNKPITITDPNATRYFMSIPQAASLVVESSIIAQPSHTYVLDMGEPVKILDAVERYLALIDSKSTINVTGLRNGEKLHEDLYDSSELRATTIHPKIFSVQTEDDFEQGLKEIDALVSDIHTGLLTGSELVNSLISIMSNRRKQWTSN